MEGEGMDHSFKKERIKMQPGCLVEAITTSYILLEPLFSSSLCFGRLSFVLTESKSLLACSTNLVRRDEEVVGAYDDRSIPFNNSTRHDVFVPLMHGGGGGSPMQFPFLCLSRS